MATRPPCSPPEYSFQASFENQLWLLYFVPFTVTVTSSLWLAKAPAFTSFFSSDSLISGFGASPAGPAFGGSVTLISFHSLPSFGAAQALEIFLSLPTTHR